VVFNFKRLINFPNQKAIRKVERENQLRNGSPNAIFYQEQKACLHASLLDFKCATKKYYIYIKTTRFIIQQANYIRLLGVLEENACNKINTKNMANEDILKDIKEHDYKLNSKYEVMKRLLMKGYDEQKVIVEFDKYYSSSIKKWSVLGLAMIILAVMYLFIYKPEFGKLRLDFDSRKYWYLLNELALKPFFILSLLIIGMNTLVDKNSINRSVRIIMTSLFSFSIIICLSVYSSLNLVLSLVFAIIGIIIFSSYEKYSIKKLSNAKETISNIKRSKNESYPSSDKKNKQVWKGSSVFLFLILSACFFISLKYEPTRLEFSGGYKYSFETIDYVLKIGTLIITLVSLVSAVLISINFSRFKFVLIGLMILSCVYIILAIIHPQFQETIYFGFLIIFTGTASLFKQKLKLTNQTENNLLDKE
jgi:hypothetical protein